MNPNGPDRNHMSNAQRKREAARRHNAELDAPKVRPLFDYLARFGGRPVQPHRSGGGENVGSIGHVDHGRSTLTAALVGLAHAHNGREQ